MTRATQDVSIYDELSDNSLGVETDGSINIKNISGTVSLPTGAATASNQTDGTQRTQLTNGTSNVTVTDNRLDVNASATPALYSQLVKVYSTYTTNQQKATYTVPAGKIFYVIFLTISGRSASVDVEWQSDTVPFTAMSLSGTNGSPSIAFALPSNAPFGPFAAGVVVRAFRISGDTNKDWSATMTGYLVDV